MIVKHLINGMSCHIYLLSAKEKFLNDLKMVFKGIDWIPQNYLLPKNWR